MSSFQCKHHCRSWKTFIFFTGFILEHNPSNPLKLYESDFNIPEKRSILVGRNPNNSVRFQQLVIGDFIEITQ
jgi:hypothetical protein